MEVVQMNDRLKVTNVQFVAASSRDAECDIVGWVSCTLNGAVRVDGITVRRMLSGDITVSYPTRKDGWGQKHAILKPLNDQVRRELQCQILAAIGLGGLQR